MVTLYGPKCSNKCSGFVYPWIADDSEWMKYVGSAKPCGMIGGGSCSTMLQAWTVGALGRCPNGDYGKRIGHGAIYKVMLQVELIPKKKSVISIKSTPGIVVPNTECC